MQPMGDDEMRNDLLAGGSNRGWRWMHDLIQDTRYASRQLRGNVGFALVAILTLALGIGANTAIFSLVHAVLLKPLPVANPNQLYSLGDAVLCCDTGEIQPSFTLYSYPLYKKVSENTPEFSSIAGYQSWLQDLGVRRNGSRDVARPYKGEFVTGNYFSTLGVDAFAGRTVTDQDDRPNAAPVAVVSYRVWQQELGLDPSVVGGTFTINSEPVTIVGVAPPNFFGETLRTDPPDFWIPLSLEPTLSRDNPLLNRTNVYWLYAIGRLRPGMQAVSLQAKVTAEVQQYLIGESKIAEKDRQRFANMHVAILPAGTGVAGLQSEYGRGLRMLMLVSMLVLLIACGNIASLLLARGTATQGQNALRVALGASRERLIRQMLTEGVFLALIGGVAGLFLALIGTRAFAALAFRGASYVPINLGLTWQLLVFALFLSLFTGVLFSVAPAWIMSRADPADMLRASGRSTREASIPQKLLVVLQAALSLVLLVGAGLLTQSLRHLEDQQFGFDTSGRVIIRLNPALAGYTPQRLPELYQKLDERLSRIPSVLSASFALHSPLDDWDWRTHISIAGHQPPPDPDAYYDRVGAHYFETIGTRLVRGRTINEHDTPASRFAGVINEAFVRKFFPHEDPIGQHIGMGDVSHSNDFEIVGIVEDAKYQDEKAPADPMLFIPLLQTVTYTSPRGMSYQTWSTFIDSIQLHVAGNPDNLYSSVQHALAEIDPNLTVLKMVSLHDQVGVRFNSPRLIARLMTLFGILALTLASIGLYGVAAYIVARRTSEIGVRMALGAGRANVVSIVMKSALLPIVIGLIAGIPLALFAGHAIASQLYGVKSYDPLVFSAATAALMLCALLAGIVPARRAASIEPMKALRTE
jgi:predicted permease